jgi:hypothetical protein
VLGDGDGIVVGDKDDVGADQSIDGADHGATTAAASASE